MKKNLFFLVLFSLIIFTGCDDSDSDNDETHSKNKVLMLKVDYVTFNFEGGIEYVFDQKTDCFTIELLYNSSSSSGPFSLIYKELNDTLITGTVHWENLGEILSPLTLISPEYFGTVSTEDIVFPKKGFTSVSFPSFSGNVEFFNAWLSIQNLEKVRRFLSSNPEQHIKIFVYTPNGLYGYFNSHYFIFIQN